MISRLSQLPNSIRQLTHLISPGQSKTTRMHAGGGGLGIAPWCGARSGNHRFGPLITVSPASFIVKKAK